MSLTSKITLWCSCIGTAGIIFYVHYRQYKDSERMHDGVIRDIQRQQRRKIENLHILQQQITLTKKLKELELREADENASGS